MNDLMKHLGKLGSELPELTEKQWEQLFNFAEFFLTVEDKDFRFDWKKVMDVLILLNKVK
jgi:hypothetical protein